MARLEHLASRKQHILSSSHLVGRSHLCLLRSTSPLVSAEHAVLRWNGARWELRDLASSNGTFVDQRRLERGQTMNVDAGLRIAFGDAADPFILVDDSPPTACAQSDGGRLLYPEAGVLAIPNPDHYEFLLFEDAPGQWLMELASGDCRAIDHRAILHGRQNWWQLDLPVILKPTCPANGSPMYVNEVGLLFQVSADEEDVAVTIVHRSGHYHLDSRASSYLLLTLARRRIQDQREALASELEHGWIERGELLDELRTDVATPARLNVEVYRMRNRFRALGVADAEHVIERRPSTRRLRLGIANIEVLEQGRRDPGRAGRS